MIYITTCISASHMNKCVEMDSHFILTTQQKKNSAAATLRSHAHLLAPHYDLMPPERFHLQTQVKDIPFPGIPHLLYQVVKNHPQL